MRNLLSLISISNPQFAFQLTSFLRYLLFKDNNKKDLVPKNLFNVVIRRVQEGRVKVQTITEGLKDNYVISFCKPL